MTTSVWQRSSGSNDERWVAMVRLRSDRRDSAVTRSGSCWVTDAARVEDLERVVEGTAGTPLGVAFRRSVPSLLHELAEHNPDPTRDVLIDASRHPVRNRG
jgi:hypothetical protein